MRDEPPSTQRRAHRLSSGAQADLWLVEANGTRSVLKIALSAAQNGALEREALLLERCAGPGLVRLLRRTATPEPVPRTTLVLAYVAGPTLAALLAQRRPSPPSAVTALLVGLAAPLTRLHALGVVHRDVAPANVVLGADGAVTLLDLGVAKAADGDSVFTPGATVGTVGYAAPEQLTAPSSVGPAADVFAVAVLTWELLVGRARYERGSEAATLAANGAAEPAAHGLNEPRSASLAALFDRALVLEPAARPTLAALVAEATALVAPDSALLASLGRAVTTDSD